jgi:type II secretory pathway pseudopilin PulG
MLTREMIRKIGIVTVLLFGWFSLSTGFGYAQEEDELLQARKLYQQGYYDDAITMLIECINKLKSIVAQKKKVAEAFYLLAKVYFTVGEDDKVDANLEKVFETYPTFNKEETDLEFKDRLDRVKVKMGIGKIAQKEPVVDEQTQVEPEPEEEKPVIKTEKEEPVKEEQRVISRVKEKRRKKFPILLVLGGLVVAAALVYFLVIKKSEDDGYDIRGNWNVNFNWYAQQIEPPGNIVLTFSGGSSSGGTFLSSSGSTGSWTVSGTQVRWVYGNGTTYTGTIQSETFMSGTMIDYAGYSGYWSASRAGTQSRTVPSSSGVYEDRAN